MAYNAKITCRCHTPDQDMVFRAAPPRFRPPSLCLGLLNETKVFHLDPGPRPGCQIQRVADPDVRHLRYVFDTVIMDAGLDTQPRSGHANLPGIVENTVS